jgi:hypothetical protein
MDSSLHLTPTSSAGVPYAAAPRQVPDTVVTPVKPAQGPATLPPERPTIAQVVSARLQDGGFASPPTEILPDDRVLRPYGMPMLPADKPDDGDLPRRETGKTVES